MNKVTQPSYLKGTQRITAVGSAYWLMGDFLITATVCVSAVVRFRSRVLSFSFETNNHLGIQ